MSPYSATERRAPHNPKVVLPQLLYNALINKQIGYCGNGAAYKYGTII